MNGYTDIKLNKTYRYKRRKRNKFIKIKTISLMVMAMVIFVGSFNMILGYNKASGTATDEYKVVKVLNGETLWDIASKYKNEDISIREAIYEISSFNNISANDLKIGMNLKIPVAMMK